MAFRRESANTQINIWAAAEGGAKRIAWIWGGGGKRTAECALQNHFWRPQKLGLVWSVPLSFKGNDRESPKKGGGGKRIVGGGSKNVFGEGFFAEFTVCFPPPWVSTPLGRSLKYASRRKGDFLPCMSHCASRLFWPHLQHWDRLVHIVGCKSTPHCRLALRDFKA